MHWNRLIAAFFALLLFTAGDASAEAERTLRLTTGKWQPYASKDAPHEGIATQLVRESFALVGIRVEFGFFPWKRAYKLARDGKWDGSIIWYDTVERRKDFFYSDPVGIVTNSFFHLKSFQFDWSGFKDLINIRVGGTSQFSYGEAFDAAERSGLFTTHRAVSDEVGLVNLLKGRIDVFPGELLVTSQQIRDTFSSQEASLFTYHPKHISKLSWHVLLSKKIDGMAVLSDRFNNGLRKLKESGRYDEILAKGLAEAGTVKQQ